MFLIPATNLDLFLISPPMSPYILFHPDFPLLYFSLTGPYCTRRIARLKALRPRKFPLLLYPICSTVNRPRPSLVRVSSGLPCVFFAQKLKPTPWPLATHICPQRSLRAPKPSISLDRVSSLSLPWLIGFLAFILLPSKYPTNLSPLCKYLYVLPSSFPRVPTC
jgi:hypothetical protein